jgi:hypothetical protein
VFASLLLGFGASTVLYLRAERQRLERTHAAEQQRHEAQKKRTAAEDDRAANRR